MAKKVLLAIIILFALIGLLFTAVFVGMQFGIFNVKGSNVLRNQFFNSRARTIDTTPPECTMNPTEECTWGTTEEWAVVKAGLIKDRAVIDRVSDETGVSSRMIAAVVTPEQIRFFTSDRELFKRFFEPLKILGTLSKFSLGVSGIKQETAVKIEEYANDSNNMRYPGDGMSALIAYSDSINHDKELFDRLTNLKSHYYSYLYTALYIKEIQWEWLRAGYDITGSPGIIATLFNLGFSASHPNPAPVIGGAPITTSTGELYSYGELAQMMYASNELVDVFPK